MTHLWPIYRTCGRTKPNGSGSDKSRANRFGRVRVQVDPTHTSPTTMPICTSWQDIYMRGVSSVGSSISPIKKTYYLSSNHRFIKVWRSAYMDYSNNNQIYVIEPTNTVRLITLETKSKSYSTWNIKNTSSIQSFQQLIG